MDSNNTPFHHKHFWLTTAALIVSFFAAGAQATTYEMQYYADGADYFYSPTIYLTSGGTHTFFVNGVPLGNYNYVAYRDSGNGYSEIWNDSTSTGWDPSFSTYVSPGYKVKLVIYDGNWNVKSVYYWYIYQANRAPSQPGTISASNISQTSARVNWGSSSDPDGDSITYYVEYKTDWSLIWNSAGSTTGTYRNLSGLQADTVYDVRVRAYDGQLYSNWRDQENAITTLPPDPEITRVSPSSPITLEYAQSQNFTVDVDNASGGVINWYMSGSYVRQSNDWFGSSGNDTESFSFSQYGSNILTATLSVNGQTDSVSWTINVPYPEIQKNNPTSSSVTLLEDESKNFTVDVENASGGVINWYINGSYVRQSNDWSGSSGNDTESFNFDSAGSYTLTATLSVNGYTDSVTWYITVNPKTGSITATLRNINDTSLPAGGTPRFFLYHTSPPEQKDGSPANFTNVPEGTYLLEGYFNGNTPFNVYELWNSEQAQINQGSNSHTLVRKYPFARDVEIINLDNGQLITDSSQTVPIGTNIQFNVKVRNDLDQTPLTAKVNLIVDTDNDGIVEWNQWSTEQSTPSNGQYHDFTFTYTTNEAGQIRYALAVYTHLANGNWEYTDSWKWTGAFGCTSLSDAAEIVSFSSSTGLLQRGDQVTATVRVKNTGTATRAFWVGLSFANEVTFDLPDDTWPIGWYDVMPQQTETLAPSEESTVVFQFEIPLWLVPGLHKAATKVWDDYNRAQHLMLPYGQPFDEDTATAFSLDVYGFEPGTLIEQFIDMARSTETWRGIEGEIGSKYLQKEKMLIFLSVGTRYGADFAGTVLIDLPDMMGFTAEGYNDEWVTVWIDGSVSLLSASLIPVTAGVTGYEFTDLNTADVRDADYQTQVLSGSFFGTSITVLTVDSGGKLSWFEKNRDFETNISGSVISGGMGLTRYEIKREYLRAAFLNVVSPGLNKEEIFAFLCELIDDIIENGTEGNEFRIPGTNDDGNWKPDTPTNLWPENGAMGVSTGPVLWSSPYHDQDGDLLLSGRFQIDDDSDFSSPVYDNENLDDTIELPEGFLNHNTQYYWRTCYQDWRNAWSNWSTSTMFTTISSGVQLSLIVMPDNREVGPNSGSISFSVSNAGAGTMPWTAEVINGGSWLSIISGSSGTNSGTVQVSFSSNPSTDPRIGTIMVTAPGAAESPTDVTITQAGTEIVQYTLSVNSSGASNVSISSTTGHGGTTNYTKTAIDGTSVNLQAPQYVGSGASRMSFSGWTGSVTNSNQSIAFTMDSPKTFTANYISDPVYTLSVNTQGQGTVILDPPGGTYDAGTIVELSAQANTGWHFVRWEGDSSGSTNPETIQMDRDKNVTAVFESDIFQYIITASAGPNGMVEPNGIFDVNLGDSLQFTAIPYENYAVNRWYLDSAQSQTGGENFSLLNIQDDHTVTVTFRKITPVIYVDDNSFYDPGPGDSNVSDTNENGSLLHPFDAIQEAIDVAYDNDTVVVFDGIYRGIGNVDVNFMGKKITVQSENGPEFCIIDCNASEYNEHRAFIIQSTNSVLDGFTITNAYWGNSACTGYSPYPTGGAVSAAYSTTIQNCSFINNTIACEGSGGAISGGGTIINCSFIDNYAAWAGGAISSSNANIMNCMFIGNRGYVYAGGAVGISGNSSIVNCVFSNNYSSRGGAIYNDGQLNVICCTSHNDIGDPEAIYNSGTLNIHNCILRNDYAPSPLVSDLNSVTVSCTDIFGGWPGIGNIDIDPCFADPNNYDFHLKSEYGRWDPNNQKWIYDDTTSPCIDTGDPNNPDWINELWPDGKCINMGAYGGTPEASMSSSNVGNIADLDKDGDVDFNDLMIFSEGWPIEDILLPEDLDRNGSVDFNDFSIFADNWGDIEEDELRVLIQNALSFAQERLSSTAQILTVSEYPMYTTGSYADWYITDSTIWSCGFYPGALWLTYEWNLDPNFLTWATNWMAGVEDRKNDKTTHDIGFIIFNSYGNAYRITGNPNYRDVVLIAAQSLATRYNSEVGCIRSWSWGSWQYPVIIDNMMNLELLFWGSQNGGEPNWYDMALSHAYKSAEYLVRENGSTYHLVDFDPSTGNMLVQETREGYSDNSTWARGQAWGLYGFTVAYRETGDPNLLGTAKKVADYFIDNLPADFITYWDFNAPDIPNYDRDTSAASIAASGLLELSILVPEIQNKQKYYNAAREILISLCSNYSNGGYLAQDNIGVPLSRGLLLEGCYHHPLGQTGYTRLHESLIWGDYYFIEAMLRYQSIDAP